MCRDANFHHYFKPDTGMFEANNETIYGIQKPFWGYFWITTWLLTIVLSLTGNFIILTASIKYRAIRLDKVGFGIIVIN